MATDYGYQVRLYSRWAGTYFCFIHTLGVKLIWLYLAQSLYYGFLDGATDWFTLPKKGLKKQGIWGLIKGIIQGLLNLGLKPAAGMF
jgi:hypothetical protein